jgi:hypothetical protein
MAQSKRADPSDQQVMLKRSFSDEIIDQLKNTQTVFFYKKDNIDAVDSFKQAITASWDLTPIIFDDIDNFEKYASDPKFSYFIIEGISTTVYTQNGSMTTSSYTNTHYFLTLRLFKDISRKGKVQTNGLCRIELYPNTESLFMGTNAPRKNHVIDKLYEKGGFYNWSPIFLKAQIGAVSTNLKNHMRPWLFQDIRSDNLAGLLSKDTLYVPKSVLVSFNKFNGKEVQQAGDVFMGYPYRYRICSDEELYHIFQVKNRGRLLFEYVKSSTDKFVSIYDLKEKQILYKKYTPISYNLKDKDIRKIYE